MKLWHPQEGPQLAALEADWADEVFFGGERGGGKSDFQLGYQQDGAFRYGKHWRGIMFRKTYAELEELQDRAMQIFSDSDGQFRSQQSANFPFSNCWYWPNGASVKMRYIENEKDYGRYHGHQYTGISFDEVTEYPTPTGLLKMLSTLRSAAGVPCTVRLTGNPGGVGHLWVKSRYIDIAPSLMPYTDPETGFTRMFIPSRLADNVILLANDPTYRNRILAATGGNEALRKAWLEGDWNIVAGAFFDCWRPAMVLRPFTIPKEWIRFRSGDWGSARPYSFGWWTVVQESFSHNGQQIPRGAIVRYRELYGAKDRINQPNVGTKEDAETIGARIIGLERDEKIDYGVLDPAAFASDGGPSIAERLFKGSGSKVMFRRADNSRVGTRGALGGWDQMRSRMIGEDGRPMVYCFDTCIDSIRTIPLLQHDAKRLEDVDTDMEDHCFTGDTLVETGVGAIPIEMLVGPYGGTVVTISGHIADYRSCAKLKCNAEIVRIMFDDGRTVRCTPDHKFLVENDDWSYDWCEASDLAGRECLQASLAKQFKNSMASATTDAASISSVRAFASISRFGNIITGLYRLAVTSITAMMTARAMSPVILNASRCRNIWAESTGANPAFAGLPLYPLHELRLPSGTDQKRGAHGTAITLTSISGPKWSGAFRQFVSNAAKIIKSAPRELPRANSVAQIAKPVRCVSVERLSERADVYCLTVPSTGCFAIEGGLLVSNCGDDWRYACMSRPYRRQIEEAKEPRFLHQAMAKEIFWPSGEIGKAESDSADGRI